MNRATTQVPVGRTALRVTRMGLGTAPLLGKERQPDDPKASATVQYAINKGLRLIDTAPLYRQGGSETALGYALDGIEHDRYVIQTKVGRILTPDKVLFDFSRDAVLRSIESSLQRLKVDRLDSVLVHDPDNHYREALDHAFPTLADLRSQGVIGAIGSGMNQWQMLRDFALHADVDCFLLAGRYTLLEQTSVEEFLPLCRQKNIAVFLGGVYNSGILATGARPGATYNYREAPPEITDKVTRIEAVCNRYNVPLYVAALQFPLANEAVTSLVIGAQTPAEVEANMAALEIPIPAGMWQELKHEGLIHEAAPVPH